MTSPEHTHITKKCGCYWAVDGTPVALCPDHRYNPRAQVTPIGVLCSNCSFG